MLLLLHYQIKGSKKSGQFKDTQRYLMPPFYTHSHTIDMHSLHPYIEDVKEVGGRNTNISHVAPWSGDLILYV